MTTCSVQQNNGTLSLATNLSNESDNTDVEFRCGLMIVNHVFLLGGHFVNLVNGNCRVLHDQ